MRLTRHGPCFSAYAFAAAPAMLALVAGGAAAAEPAQPITTLDRIQVTVTRTPQLSRTIPAAITVVDTADLRDAALGVQVSDALDGVPGVLARTRQNYAQDEQISIRGFGTRASFGIRGVRLYVDGVPATMPDGQGQLSHFPLATAQRIEILRGPFSALYGNAAGGVIQLFTADGEAPGEVGAALVGGRSGSRRASVDLRGARGRAGYTLGLSHFATDGYRDHSRAERTLFNAKANFDSGPSRFSVSANALHAPHALDPLGLDRAQFHADPRQATAGAHLFNTRKSVTQRQLGTVVEHDLSDATQLRLLAYGGERHVEQYLAIPVATQRNPLSGGGVIDLRSPYAGVDARWTQRATLGERPLEWSVGVNYDRQDQDRRGYENFVGDRLGVRGALRLRQDDRVVAFDQYAQASWTPVEAWSLMAGVRHSEVEFRSRDGYVTAANPDDSGTVRYRATSPVFGAGWKPAAPWFAYLSFGRGFETPTFNELGYRADGRGPNLSLQPARTRSGEAGLRYAREHVRSEIVLFRSDTRDELTVDTSSGGRTTFRNVGRARRQGAEWSAALPLLAGWRGEFALTYLDARFAEAFLACVSTPCAAADTPVAAGTRIPGVPRTTAYAAMRRGGEVGWQVRLEGRYVGDVPVNHRDDERAPGYAVLGAGADYGFRRGRDEGRLFLAVDNVFDRRYAGSVIVNEGNRRYYEPAAGRSFTMGLEWRWRD